MRKQVQALLCVFFFLATFGCGARKNPATGQPEVLTPEMKLNRAANYGQAATRSLKELQEIVIGLEARNGISPDDTAVLITQILLTNNALQSAKNAVSELEKKRAAGAAISDADFIELRSLFQVFATRLHELNQAGVLRIKNTEAQQAFGTAVNSLLAVAQTVVALWGGF